MKLPLLSPWWLCLLILPVSAFLILDSSRENSKPTAPAATAEVQPARESVHTAPPAYEPSGSQVAPTGTPAQQQIQRSMEADAKSEEPARALTLEIRPDQAVPAAFASFAKDFTPQDISVAQQLRQAFYDAVANLSPKDPDFTAKWNAAQKENDDLYRLYYGRDRYLAQHRKAYTESFGDSGSQQSVD